MVKGASAKWSPLPRQAGGKKQPAAYRAASTNSESPYWRREVVLTQDPLELFGMLLLIVKTGRGIRPGQPPTGSLWVWPWMQMFHRHVCSS